jgi:protein tyrosine/serine phosphatase
MDFCSYFIKNKALFGCYPSQDNVTQLEKIGVKYMVDLTHKKEKKIVRYKTKCNYINFPIEDNYIPVNQNFDRLIIDLSNIIRNLSTNSCIYIHCKGGHGRSSLVVSCLLCYIYKNHPTKSINLITKYHNSRPNLKRKWINKHMNKKQICYVYKKFKLFYIKNSLLNFFDIFFSEIKYTKTIYNQIYDIIKFICYNFNDTYKIMICSRIKPIYLKNKLLVKALYDIREKHITRYEKI